MSELFSRCLTLELPVNPLRVGIKQKKHTLKFTTLKAPFVVMTMYWDGKTSTEKCCSFNRKSILLLQIVLFSDGGKTGAFHRPMGIVSARQQRTWKQNYCSSSTQGIKACLLLSPV